MTKEKKCKRCEYNLTYKFSAFNNKIGKGEIIKEYLHRSLMLSKLQFKKQKLLNIITKSQTQTRNYKARKVVCVCIYAYVCLESLVFNKPQTNDNCILDMKV